MTKAAQHFGKDLSNFMRSPDVVAYIEALSVVFTDKELIKTQRGNGNLPSVGTWAHPKLAVRFARWLDVKFEVWCDSVIEDILTKKAEVVVTKPQESSLVATTQALGMNNQMVNALALFMQATTTEVSEVKQAVAVADHAAEDLLENPLKYLEAIMGQANDVLPRPYSANQQSALFRHGG